MNSLTAIRPKLHSPSKPIKIGFIPTFVSGVAYYRMAAFAWEMRKRHNVSTVTSPFSFSHLEDNPWQNDMVTNPNVIKHIESIVEWSDVVVWQLLQFPHSLELFQDLKIKYQKTFLMEVDDYFTDIPAENMAFEAYRPNSVNYKCCMAGIRQADGLIVSTPYLAELYKGENQNVHVIPNSIDFKGHTGRPKIVGWDSVHIRSHDRIRLGWIGGGTHSADLEMVAPALSDILDEHPNVWLYVIHGVPQIFKDWAKQGRNVYWTHKWATINLYPRHLAAYCFDVGLAPLIDNNFNRAKSNLRWLEYSALKVPTVASPLPDFSRVITHGEDGFIARDTDDWKKHLTLLIQNPAIRESVGRNAYNKVKTDFNVKKTAQDYLNYLRGILHG